MRAAYCQALLRMLLTLPCALCSVGQVIKPALAKEPVDAPAMATSVVDADQNLSEVPWGAIANGTELIVTTTVGQRLTGQLDARSSDDYLWLTTPVGDSGSMSSLLMVNQVQRIELAGAQTPHAIEQSLTASVANPVVKTVHNERVNSLDAQLQPINIDRDAQLDGIALWLFPRDRYGRTLVKPGAVQIQLDIYSVDVHDRVVLRQSETWSQILKAEDYDANGVGHLRLSFRKIDLSRYPGLAIAGVARVSLRIPGENVLQTQTDSTWFSSVLSHPTQSRPAF